eukprot:g3300.t1
MEIVLNSQEGTLIELLDTLAPIAKKHVWHRGVVANDQRGKKQRQEGRRPGQVDGDFDFGENGSMENFRKVQREHWTSGTKQFTLFIAVFSWLVAAEWNKTDGELQEGAAVTVKGEKAGEAINKASFFARVVSFFMKDDVEFCVVATDDGKQHTVERAVLRHRVERTHAFAGISDDRKHDSASMQHFVRKSLAWLESKSEDFKKEDIKVLNVHSDNAAQHFKSTKSIHFFTSLKRYGGTWSFGAPGHGKGIWDGLAGMFKTFVRNLIKAGHRNPDLICTNSKQIKTAQDVKQVLQAEFEQEEWREKQKREGKRIQHITILGAFEGTSNDDDSAIERPIETVKHTTIAGIQNSYQFYKLVL